MSTTYTPAFAAAQSCQCCRQRPITVSYGESDADNRLQNWGVCDQCHVNCGSDADGRPVHAARDSRPIPSLGRLIRAIGDIHIYAGIDHPEMVERSRELAIQAAVDLLDWDDRAEAEREVRQVI